MNEKPLISTRKWYGLILWSIHSGPLIVLLGDLCPRSQDLIENLGKSVTLAFSCTLSSPAAVKKIGKMVFHGKTFQSTGVKMSFMQSQGHWGGIRYDFSHPQWQGTNIWLLELDRALSKIASFSGSHQRFSFRNRWCCLRNGDARTTSLHPLHYWYTWAGLCYTDHTTIREIDFCNVGPQNADQIGNTSYLTCQLTLYACLRQTNSVLCQSFLLGIMFRYNAFNLKLASMTCLFSIIILPHRTSSGWSLQRRGGWLYFGSKPRRKSHLNVFQRVSQ